MDRTGRLNLRKISDGTILHTENVQDGVAIAMNPSSSRLAWLTNDSIISILDTAPGGKVTVITTEVPAPWAIAISADGTSVAAVGQGNYFIGSVFPLVHAIGFSIQADVVTHHVHSLGKSVG